MSEGFTDDSPFEQRIVAQGKALPVACCTCPKCQAEFYVADIGDTDDWHPKFCCYCGREFTGKRVLALEISVAIKEVPPSS